MWKVTNPSPETIHFQIGAHPAFLFRGEAEDGIKGYFSVHTSETPEYILISEKGCVAADKPYKAELEDGHYIAIGPETFARDALIFENHQVSRIELCGPCRAEFPYLKNLYSKTDRSEFEILGIAGLPWVQVIADKSNRLLETYGIYGYPTNFLLNPEGVIIAKNLRGKTLEEKVLGLLEE